ncbi:MAG: hypothetical protein WCQ32_03440 [bacterium]
MAEYLKSITAGITEGLVSGLQPKSKIEHLSTDGGSMEITGNYSSVTKNTGIHLTGNAQIKITGNAKITQQD